MAMKRIRLVKKPYASKVLSKNIKRITKKTNTKPTQGGKSR